ncbi:hypothetical protein F5X97DRAFT_212976 [Nemania serpens]|nr:hypothetical protein F5X97DRAFT_212976 [Nemania serpens]
MQLLPALPALPALLALLASAPPTSASARPKDAILLSTVQSLTLRADKPAAHRRVPPVPQLRCVSSPRVCALHAVDVMRCSNQGSSYGAEDVEWSCSAALPPELKLGATDVLCEGYAGPDDPYVLRGSCGVEYRLVLTELGEKRFPDIANGGGGGGGGGWFSRWGGGGGGSSSSSGGGGKPLRSPDPDGQGSDLNAWLFGIVFVGVLLWIVYSAWTQAGAPRAVQRRPRNNNRFFGGGGGFDPGFGPGGGGGGGYGDDPPPPYSKYSSSQAGWRPGFWSGVAGGAAAAYLAGNRRDRQQETRNFYGGGSSSSGGWGSRPGPSSDSGAGSTSSSRYTSTGFGSTSRR